MRLPTLSKGDTVLVEVRGDTPISAVITDVENHILHITSTGNGYQYTVDTHHNRITSVGNQPKRSSPVVDVIKQKPLDDDETAQ